MHLRRRGLLHNLPRVHHARGAKRRDSPVLVAGEEAAGGPAPGHELLRQEAGSSAGKLLRGGGVQHDVHAQVHAPGLHGAENPMRGRLYPRLQAGPHVAGQVPRLVAHQLEHQRRHRQRPRHCRRLVLRLGEGWIVNAAHEECIRGIPGLMEPLQWGSGCVRDLRWRRGVGQRFGAEADVVWQVRVLVVEGVAGDGHRRCLQLRHLLLHQQRCHGRLGRRRPCAREDDVYGRGGQVVQIQRERRGGKLKLTL
mmetsp:Transcript_22940/g.43851  ORF Transcript_22940/g.43851 Transcript_22940/m.43851 type:complete len:252 (+) Transcript_22940:1063-1818(+)